MREPYFRENGLQGVLHLSGIKVLRTGPFVFQLLDKFKEGFDQFLEQNDNLDNAKLLEALWFRSNAINDADHQNLIASGAESFVSASGLQVFLLFGMVTGCLGLLNIDRRFQIAIGAVVLIFYWLVTGMHGNTGRALFTCIALSSAYLLRRVPDICSFAACAGTLYLIFFPRSITSLGFQLSLGVCIGVGLFYRPSVHESAISRFKNSLALAAIVLLVGQPLVAAHTGQISFGQLFSTLYLGLLTPIILVASLIGFLCHGWLPVLSQGLMVLIVAPLTWFFRAAIQSLAQLPLSIETSWIGPYALWIYYGLWLLIWKPYRRNVTD
jgi:ComEC/Rec2-related protein